MFKYYSTPDLKTIESIIGKTPSIKFSSAYNLNDPFELKFNLSIDPDDNSQKDAYFKTNPNATLSEFNEWHQNVKTNPNFVWHIEQEYRNTLVQQLTLCCFTKDNKNNLMWSHYANNHRGICVEYAPLLFIYLQTVDKYLYASKVRYSKLPPIVGNLEDMYSQTLKMVFNKQKEWKYEQEYRVALFSDFETDFIGIGSELIKSVYIGSKASQRNIDSVIELTKSTDIEIFYGITLGESYEVQFKKHKEGTIYMRSFL